jgi:molybdopterin synthase sulfur carrier subunit
MPYVKFTKNLERFFPGLSDLSVEAATVADVVKAVDSRWPGLAAYIVDERGALRKHVNIFIGEDMILDRERLSDAVDHNSRVYIFQALSGG